MIPLLENYNCFPIGSLLEVSPLTPYLLVKVILLKTNLMIEKLPILPSYSSVAITCMVPANPGHTCIQTSPPESKKQQSGSFLSLQWQSATENTPSLKVQKSTVAMSWNSTEEINIIYSVQFSCLVISDSLQPHKSQHIRPPCPSPTPREHPDPCPLSQ